MAPETFRRAAINQALKSTLYIFLTIGAALLVFILLYGAIKEMIYYHDEQTLWKEEFFSAQGMQEIISEEEPPGMRCYDTPNNEGDESNGAPTDVDGIFINWS